MSLEEKGRDPDFWAGKWSANAIGWHQSEPQAVFVQAVDRLVASGTLASPRRVLVPLCGKSVDVLHAASRGVGVVGVEFVEQGARDFFAECGGEPPVESQLALSSGEGTVLSLASRDGLIRILVADIFTLSPEDLSVDGPIALVYDRAAIVAIPPKLRTDYAALMCRVMDHSRKAGVEPNLLQVTVEYDPAPEVPMPCGPPHSIKPDEIYTLYSAAFGDDASPEILEFKSILSDTFRERFKIDAMDCHALLYGPDQKK
eukprot:TRINITY_DN673_c1_g1_i1.p1 TRINITY_DN673_c1_g1~~TRINITY_DN673_c1_g1_i1.p1  ORF type:complete len:258 (+),score=118.50 TRINITY_DN673_c1_g1_i1:367-1140(+)